MAFYTKEGLPVPPNELIDKFKTTIRDIKILISRTNFMLDKVFAANQEEQEIDPLEARRVFMDFYEDFHQKGDTFDELMVMMGTFNRENSHTLGETEALEEDHDDIDDDETVS
jgi:exonuclease III